MIEDYRDEALLSAEKAEQSKKEARAAELSAKAAATEAQEALKIVKFPVINTTPIAYGHRVTITDAEGTKHFDIMNGKDGEGVLSDSEIALLGKLSQWYEDEHYVAMTGTFTMSPSTTTYEIGSSQSVTFSWTFSKLPIEVTFNGVAQAVAESGSKTETVISMSHATKVYRIYGEYKEGETASKSFSINFRNKYYYGCKAKFPIVDSDFIKSLSSSGWANNKTASFTPNCTAGTYVWYAYPKRLGAATMWMGGFQGGFEDPLTVSVTNGSGFTEDYYVYCSTNAGIGSLSIEAK